jgi:hypothetical protein
MGGQIIYDLVTTFLPALQQYAHIHIDFWCATASQVGFFEETKQHIASDETVGEGSRVPFPSNNLGVWWNVWDSNDILSFTAHNIIDGVDDQGVDTGHSLCGAHAGYLSSLRFFELFAEKLEAAKRTQWRHQ